MASGRGAEIDAAQLPLSDALKSAAGAQALRFALGAGDDYELLWSAPAEARARIEALAAGLRLTRIGSITVEPGLRVTGAEVERDAVHGFDHFTG